MKPKVSALIQTRASTLVLDFPKSIAELRVALLQSGIPEPPRDIFLMDNEGDPIRVKVYSAKQKRRLCGLEESGKEYRITQEPALPGRLYRGELA